MKKRNAQDATRKHDVAPLRRRITELERTVTRLNKYCDTLHTRLSKMEAAVKKLQQADVVFGKAIDALLKAR